MIKSMRSCFSVTVLVVAVLCARRLDADVLLVENGQPKATIVVAAEPTEQAQHAAQELQTYLERITGAELAIQSEAEAVSGARILVGRSQAVADLGVEAPSGHSYEMNEEGFVVKTIGQDLVLAGNEEWHYRGTVFAVYDLLEELGCRWFFPGPYGEVVPSMETILVPDVDREERPSFRFRNIWYSGWMPVREGDSANLSKWTDCNKMNSLKGLSLPGDGSITRLAPPEGPPPPTCHAQSARSPTAPELCEVVGISGLPTHETSRW